MDLRSDQPLLWINGFPVCQFIGAEGGDDDGRGDNTEDESVEEGVGASGSGKDPKDDLEAVTARMKAADRNAAEARKALEAANAKIKEFEDKDRSELEKAQNDAREAQEVRDKLNQTVSGLRMQVAFLSSNDVNWHDPAVALRLLDTTDISIDDDGNVKGMKEAIKRLADGHKYLVKSKDGDAGNGDEERPPRKKTGDSTNGSVGGGSKIDRKKMEERFPALRGR